MDKKWYKIDKNCVVHNTILKKELKGNKNKGKGNFNILVNIIGIWWKVLV